MRHFRLPWGTRVGVEIPRIVTTVTHELLLRHRMLRHRFLRFARNISSDYVASISSSRMNDSLFARTSSFGDGDNSLDVFSKQDVHINVPWEFNIEDKPYRKAQCIGYIQHLSQRVEAHVCVIQCRNVSYKLYIIISSFEK